MKRSLGILAIVFVVMLSAVWQVSTAQKHKPEKLSKQQLLSPIASAKTPAEHRRVAEYYHATAQDYLAQAKEHQEMAKAYKKNPMTSSSKFATGTVNHCEYFAQSFKYMATKMQELADMHEQMAKDAGAM
ncbi:MAG TPA: hypothetical protein VKX41_16980 [Alloacidobacterium sp.]|jgi:hypothetical protein|nr:hypothetical protein [Alloacidobacterium sp.]